MELYCCHDVVVPVQGMPLEAGGFGRELVFSNTTTNNTFAAFLWNDTYELNGITENLSSNYTISNHRESLVLFRYNYTA